MLLKHVTLTIALAGFATAAWDIDKPRPKNGTTLVQRGGGSNISPNARCGANYNGYTCQGSQFGNCCSQYNYCGSTSAYCGTGCQSGFGTCSSSSRPSSSSVPAARSSTSSSSRPATPSPSSPGKISPNARCGYLHGATAGYTCQGSKFGNCCSDQSYCGSSEAYCGKGCQSGFGSCSTNPKSSSMTTSTRTSSSIASSSSSSSSSMTSSAVLSSSSTISSSSSAPASSSSSAPLNLPTAGVLQVFKASDNSLVGYVSKSFTSSSTQRFGITTDVTNALNVQATIPLGQTSVTQSQLFIPNPPGGSNPYLCFCVGPADDSDNLSVGSFNYLLLTTCPTAVPAGPPGPNGNSYNSGEDSETALWNINLITGLVTASWVNTDNTVPAQHIAYLPGSDGLLNVGDQAAFDAGFPGGYEVRVQLVGVA